jgi:hypothetical protein
MHASVRVEAKTAPRANTCSRGTTPLRIGSRLRLNEHATPLGPKERSAECLASARSRRFGNGECRASEKRASELGNRARL